MVERLTVDRHDLNSILRLGVGSPVEISSFSILIPANVAPPEAGPSTFILPRFFLTGAMERLAMLPIKITPQDSSEAGLTADAQVVPGHDYEHSRLERELLFRFNQRIMLTVLSRRTQLNSDPLGNYHRLPLSDSQIFQMGPIKISAIEFQNHHGK